MLIKCPISYCQLNELSVCEEFRTVPDTVAVVFQLLNSAACINKCFSGLLKGDEARLIS